MAPRASFERASETAEHLALDLCDLLPQRLDAIERPAAVPRLREDPVDLPEDVPDLRVRLDRGAALELARVPVAERVVAQLARLVEEHADLVLVATEQLADGRAHLRALRGVAPE